MSNINFSFIQDIIHLHNQTRLVLIICYANCLIALFTVISTPKGLNKINVSIFGALTGILGCSIARLEETLSIKLQELDLTNRATSKELLAGMLKNNDFSLTLPNTVALENIELNFFNFEDLKLHPDKYPHIRVIGRTGVGKTRFTEYLMDILGGEQFVVTPKRKPSDWKNHKVYGYPFNYEECEAKLKEIHQHMYERYKLIEQNISLHQLNFVVDEWKLINSNIPTAKELMKEIIVVARDARIRMIVLAQGENVKTWGMDGESDLEECFTSIRFGDFATEHCKSLRNKYRKGSDEFNYYSAVLSHLGSTGFRCMMVDNSPAICPDLSNWTAANSKDNSLPGTIINTSTPEQLVSAKISENAAGSELEALKDGNLDPRNAELSEENKVKYARILISEGYSKNHVIKLLWDITGGRKYSELARLLDN